MTLTIPTPRIQYAKEDSSYRDFDLKCSLLQFKILLAAHHIKTINGLIIEIGPPSKLVNDSDWADVGLLRQVAIPVFCLLRPHSGEAMNEGNRNGDEDEEIQASCY